MANQSALRLGLTLLTGLLFAACSSTVAPKAAQPATQPITSAAVPSSATTAAAPSASATIATVTATTTPVPTPATPTAAQTPAGIPGLVAVGAYWLYLNCTGTGSPTVVLENGGGRTSADWSQVQPAVSTATRVCSYDRANIGKSDQTPGPRTSHQMVADLQALLHAAGIAPPYVLVGHSFGGLNVRLYAGEHPEETAGLVLVDATPAEWLDRMKADAPARVWNAWLSSSRGAEGGWDIEASLLEVQQAIIPGIPVTLLEHTPGRGDNLPGGWPEGQMAWDDLQTALAQRIPKSTLTIADHSGHYIALDQPELVTQAILGVLAAVSAR